MESESLTLIFPLYQWVMLLIYWSWCLSAYYAIFCQREIKILMIIITTEAAFFYCPDKSIFNHNRSNLLVIPRKVVLATTEASFFWYQNERSFEHIGNNFLSFSHNGRRVSNIKTSTILLKAKAWRKLVLAIREHFLGINKISFIHNGSK